MYIINKHKHLISSRRQRKCIKCVFFSHRGSCALFFWTGLFKIVGAKWHYCSQPTIPWFYWFTLAKCVENMLWMLLNELSWAFCLTKGWWEAKAWNCQPNKEAIPLFSFFAGMDSKERGRRTRFGLVFVLWKRSICSKGIPDILALPENDVNSS